MLEKPLVRGTVSTAYNITRLENTARQDPDNLPTIAVGVLDGRYYPMSGLDVVEACRNAAVRKINARVQHYESKRDIIINHMKEMSGGDCIDPLRIRSVIDELGILGLSVDDALKKINQKGTDLEKLVKSNISDEVLDMFTKFIDGELSDKLPPETVPVLAPIVNRIAILDTLMQTVIAKEVIAATIPRPTTTFTWPSPAEVMYIIENTPKPEVHDDPVFVKPEPPHDDMLKPKESATGKNKKPSKPKKETPPQIDEDDKKDIQRIAKDCVVLYDDKGKPKTLVHTKNKTAHNITKAAEGKAYKLHENIGKPAHLMPLEHDKHLEIESRPLYGRTFDDKKAAIEFIKSIEGQNIKLSVLWTVE